MATVDVTVMGAGIFGLSVAYACLRRGAKVQVIDPNGVAAGASGGIVGALAPHVPEQWNAKKQFQLESLLMAADFWAEVEGASGQTTGYIRSGRLQPLQDGAAVELAQSRAAGAEELWQGAASWTVQPSPRTHWVPPSATGFVVRDTLSALIYPRLATRALASAVQQLGGDVSSDAGPKGRVVWATGWSGLVEITQAHSRLVGNGVKGQAVLLEYDARGAPQIFADTIHFIPHLDGTVAIGSTTEREFDDPVETDAGLDQLLERAYQVMPALMDAKVLGKWAGVRPRSRSRAPMLGHHPFRDGDYVANGGFKIGFGMAPKIGDVMADLILTGQNAIPESFRTDLI